MKREFWSNFYTLPDPDLWQGRHDALPNEQMYQHVKCIDLLSENLTTQVTNNVFALIGFCCDEGVKRNSGRPGAFFGPPTIRKTLGKSSTHFSRPLQILDVGNIICQNADLEEAQTALSEVVNLLLQHKIRPIVLGGGHETAWGHYQGLEKNLPPSLGIINFDAHFDLRPLTADKQGHSGTPFLQIAKHRQSRSLSFDYFCIGIQKNANTKTLFTTAQELNTRYIEAEKLYLNTKETFNDLDHFIESHNAIYLSICLDVFNIAFAPGVSAPQILGLTPWQVIPLIEKITQSGKVVSIDFVELSPLWDEDNKTAMLTASLIMAYLHTTSLLL